MTSPRTIQHILICDTRGDELAAYLNERRPELACRVRTADAVNDADRQWATTLIGFAAPLILAGSSIRWVHSTGAGVDGLLGNEWPTDVTLTRTVGELGTRIAEYCLGHALAHAQRIRPFSQDQAQRRWVPVEPATIRGTTCVVVGTGSVGTAVAKCFHAIGCRVIGVSRTGQGSPPFDQVHPVDGLAHAVTTAHWLVLAAPLTTATRQLVNANILNHCDGAFLINVARGGLLDTTALLAAIGQGTVVGATLDVFNDEPLPPESPLWTASGVSITPHIAGVTHVEEAGSAFLAALATLEAGETPSCSVDPKREY